MTMQSMFTDWQMAPENVCTDPRPFFASEPVISLATSRVLVLGCGSVGGLAAWGLASAGVGALTLIDRDRVEPDNLRRHVCGVGAVGTPKALALARFLGHRFPAATLDAHDLDALERPDELRELIGLSDAVLVAVDAEGPKHLSDAMARELGKPVVYVGVYAGGWAGEVILSDAEVGTPCYACTARALGRVGIPLFPEVVGPDYALPVIEVAETDWPRADLTSLMPVAALATRVLVARLLMEQGQERSLVELTESDISAWRLPLRAVPGWGGPWNLVPCSIGSRADCRECQPATGHC